MDNGTKANKPPPSGETEPGGQPAEVEGESIEEFRRRLALAPHNTDLRLRVARRLAEYGRWQEALEELRILVRLDPNHLVARKLRQQLLYQASEPDPDGASPVNPEALH